MCFFVILKTNRLKRLIANEVISSNLKGSAPEKELVSSRILREAKEKAASASERNRFRCQEHFWASMTNESLKAILKVLGLSRSGDKQALIARLAKERDSTLEWLPDVLLLDARARASAKKGATARSAPDILCLMSQRRDEIC